MPDKHVDLIGINGGVGDVANRFVQRGGFDLGRMRPFIDDESGLPYVSVYKGGDITADESYETIQHNAGATLRRDEWTQLDEALQMVARYRLGGVQDIIGRGLTYNLGNAMGTTVLEWHDVSDAMEADLTMDGVTRSIGDRPTFQHNYLPIPIIHVDYEINARVLEASRRLGNPLDTTAAERAARKVLEKLENMLFTDTSYSYGEKDSRNLNTIYSLVNHPDRNLVNLTTNWDASAMTAAGILQDVQEMKQASINAYHYGPWMLYVPTAYETVLDDDYDAAGSSLMTIRERILKLGGILGIKVVDTLAANNVLLVQMTPDVVRIVRGMDLRNVEWQTEGGMVTKFKVMTIQVPQIRSDMNKKSGIVHLS
jgi:uncharacterized linocin/CFP29 family protein